MMKVIIYGAGGHGKNVRYGLDDFTYEIVGYIDNNFTRGGYIDSIPVYVENDIGNLEFDYIILSMEKGRKEIIDSLVKKGVPNEKILFYSYEKLESVCNSIRLQDNRNAIMRMCIKTISERNVEGSIAEVGVYQGEFAKYLSKYFPNRKLYLFDTFGGMNGNTEVERITKGQNFSDTSIDLVISKICNKQNCIIKKGFFPDTAEDIDDKFSFVSLDTDLYESIYAGLAFFYPRLSKGGYIFVHDYWVYTWGGVKKAVREFCDRYEIGYVPINDLCGSVIITK